VAGWAAPRTELRSTLLGEQGPASKPAGPMIPSRELSGRRDRTFARAAVRVASHRLRSLQLTARTGRAGHPLPVPRHDRRGAQKLPGRRSPGRARPAGRPDGRQV